MNPTLRFAIKELKKIKKVEEDSQVDMLIITIDFGRPDDCLQPAGYPPFLDALEALGGEWTEENIQEACRVSGLSRGSVHYGNEEEYEPIVIKRPIPRYLSKRLSSNNEQI